MKVSKKNISKKRNENIAMNKKKKKIENSYFRIERKDNKEKYSEEES